MYGHRLYINPGFSHFVADCETFRQTIRSQANQQRQYTDEDGNVVRVFEGAGFEENECNVIGFVDTNPYRTSRLGSGPAGQKGSDRKRNSHERQQAIYNRYGKIHGVKPLACVLPNGMALLYGPVLIQQNDNRVLDWSQADDYLHGIFQNEGTPDGTYVFYGDAIFVGAQHCFRTRIEPLVAGAQLPPQLECWNQGMRCVCEEIEHYYGGATDLWHLSDHHKLFHLGCIPEVVIAEIQTIFLLTNVFACFRQGNTVLSVFGLLPPTIDKYLTLLN